MREIVTPVVVAVILRRSMFASYVNGGVKFCNCTQVLTGAMTFYLYRNSTSVSGMLSWGRLFN